MSQRKPHNTSQSGVPDRDLPTCIAEQNSPAFLPDVAGSLAAIHTPYHGTQTPDKHTPTWFNNDDDEIIIPL